jgi:hypothetical protein
VFKINESNKDLRGTAAFLCPSFIASVKNTSKNVEKILLGGDEKVIGDGLSYFAFKSLTWKN